MKVWKKLTVNDVVSFSRRFRVEIYDCFLIDLNTKLSFRLNRDLKRWDTEPLDTIKNINDMRFLFTFNDDLLFQWPVSLLLVSEGDEEERWTVEI